jgi:hypothetical protein
MAPTDKKAVAKPATKPSAKGVVKNRKHGKRNYDLGNGVVRFSKTRMFHKKVT